MEYGRLQPIKGESAQEPTAFTKKTIKELLAEEAEAMEKAGIAHPPSQAASQSGDEPAGALLAAPHNAAPLAAATPAALQDPVHPSAPAARPALQQPPHMRAVAPEPTPEPEAAPEVAPEPAPAVQAAAPQPAEAPAPKSRSLFKRIIGG